MEHYLKDESSTIGIVATTIGLAALQICGVGAPVCGAAVGLGIISSIFPTVFINVMSKYAVYFIVFSITIQLITLYFMKCFKKF